MVFKKVRRIDAHVFDVGCSILHDLASNFLFNSYYVPIYIFLLLIMFYSIPCFPQTSIISSPIFTFSL